MRYIRIEKASTSPLNTQTATDPFACGRHFQLVDLGNALAAGSVEGDGDVVLNGLPHHEFSTVQNGRVEFEGADGQRILFDAGTSFVLPAGLHGRLVSSENMRRSFLACGRDTQGPRHERPVLVDPAAERTPCPGPAAELLLTPAPRTVASEAYRSPEGVFQAGIWQCGAFDRQPAVARHYELMQIIEGEAALQDAGYGEEPFRKGDGVLVHPGIRYVLRAKDTFAKVYATVTVSGQ